MTLIVNLASEGLSDPTWWLVGAAVGVATGLVIHWLVSRSIVRQARGTAEAEAARAREAADRLLERTRVEVEGDRAKWQAEFDSEREDVETGLLELESVLEDRERDLDRRNEDVSRRSESIEAVKRELRHLKTQRRRRERDLKRSYVEQKNVLLERASLTEEAARERILDQLTGEVEREQRGRFARHLEQVEDDLEKLARRLVGIAIARCDIKHEDSGFIGSLTLPNESFKNRLLGEDGENLHVFEELTGVNLVFDENEPLNVVLSAYDGMKKAIARRTIEKLISQNAPIQPEKVQEFVEKSTREMKKIILENGRKVCQAMKIKGLHPEMQSLLGRLDYRTSYGQNVLKHSKEVSFLAATIAAEIGADAKMAKRSSLLHDIGKAVDAEIEGGHPEIGAEIATRCKEKQPVIDSIALHHEDPDSLTLFPLLTQAADSISGSRPGARRETLERYLKHLEDLETIGKASDGVETAFAIQAGRELRVFVDPKKVSDETAREICGGIRDRVEEELTYPGKIKITVVREAKTSAFAR